jgi:AraC-like DNA-binding protein
MLFVIYYIYKVYRKKLQKQKAVARGFIENKEGWAAELNHLDESDRYFMDRFKKKILENMGNADMKMDDLGAQMLLSKVQLYRKVKAMTGKTPAELLKEMRLQRAYTLLQQTDKTISEVSAEVGFAVPGYFSSCFKKQFGVLPTDFRNEQASNKE